MKNYVICRAIHALNFKVNIPVSHDYPLTFGAQVLNKWLRKNRKVISCIHGEMIKHIKAGSSICVTPLLFKRNFWREDEGFLFNIDSDVSFYCKSDNSENFIEILRVLQKIWIFSSSLLTISLYFLDFWVFPCYKKETHGVSIYKILSAVFCLQPTLSKLGNFCIRSFYIELNLRKIWRMFKLALFLFQEKLSSKHIALWGLKNL